jgi:hypothetical protein
MGAEIVCNHCFCDSDTDMPRGLVRAVIPFGSRNYWPGRLCLRSRMEAFQISITMFDWRLVALPLDKRPEKSPIQSFLVQSLFWRQVALLILQVDDCRAVHVRGYGVGK